MNYVLGEKVSTIWLPDNINPEVEWHIRMLTGSKDQEILAKHKIRKPVEGGEDGNQGVAETWKDSQNTYLFDVFDYCLVDWNKKVVDSSGKKVKCTRENKKILFDSDKDAVKWISTNAALDLNFGDDALVKKKLLERFSGESGSNGGRTIGEPAAKDA